MHAVIRLLFLYSFLVSPCAGLQLHHGITCSPYFLYTTRLTYDASYQLPIPR